ncbi:MAG TPA: YihY/virulence factor BrkB family protein [Acidimicrobiia bacterium]|nr:YihY/virulence factor BrkB family protein [Acidimicrobiia bacterium]
MNIGRLVVDAGKDWLEDKAPRLGAALSYYTAFSLPPLLVALIGIAGIAFGADVVSDRLVEQMRGLVGAESADLLGAAIAEAQETTGPSWAVALGLALLVIAASGVFAQLQDALNTIWDVRPKPGGGIWRLIQKRLLSLAAVLGAGFLLLVSLAVSTATAALAELAGGVESLAPFVAVMDIVFSLLVVTVLFALIFKFLPDVRIRWRDVWLGAFLTAGLFIIGKFAIGFYLGTSDVGSAYGVAGSLIIIMVWIYYSALIVFFGAELTQVWTKRHESSVTPVPGAEPVVSRDTSHAPRQREPAPGWLILGAFLSGLLLGRRRSR